MAQNQHLRLSPAEVKALWSSKCFTAKGYVYLLVLSHRRIEWAWRIENVSEFCREWDIPRRTFYKAKAALISEELISENIIGAFELIPHAIAKPECEDSAENLGCALEGTGVNLIAQVVQERAQVVQERAQVVQERAQSEPETTAEKGACDPTSLKQLITTTYTGAPAPDGVCGGSENQNLETSTEILNSGTDKKSESRNVGQDSPETNFCPPILSSTKKFGVNVDDRQLRRAAEQWPERVENAIACLEEKQLTVKHPTRFLTRAIQDDWQPEKGVKRSGWGDWYDEAYRRGLVRASQGQGDTIMVMTIDNHWVPFEHLRRQSWDQLEAKLKPITVHSEKSPEEISEGAKYQILEAMAVLLEE